jgi:hypothetical protein
MTPHVTSSAPHSTLYGLILDSVVSMENAWYASTSGSPTTTSRRNVTRIFLGRWVGTISRTFAFAQSYFIRFQVIILYGHALTHSGNLAASWRIRNDFLQGCLSGHRRPSANVLLMKPQRRYKIRIRQLGRAAMETLRAPFSFLEFYIVHGLPNIGLL